MIFKFNKFERTAGVFVLLALVGAIALSLVTAIKKGWLDAKIPFQTRVESADGLRPGTSVTISGIRAGEVTEVELVSATEIIVHFEVLDKFQKQIRRDSVVQVIRPFILGDKALELTVGSTSEPTVAAGAMIQATVGFDVMDLVSGKKLGPFLGTIEGLVKNMNTLAKAFADPKRTEAFVKVFDRLDPLVQGMGSMATEVTKLSKEINQFLPQIRQESPDFGQQMAQLIHEVNGLTQVLKPAIEEVGPDLPRASRRALVALDEMVVTLKALQKSFLLSGKVEDVREEESSVLQDESKARKPAKAK